MSVVMVVYEIASLVVFNHWAQLWASAKSPKAGRSDWKAFIVK
jgi:hypothetical protein